MMVRGYNKGVGYTCKREWWIGAEERVELIWALKLVQVHKTTLLTLYAPFYFCTCGI
jgi:hypothetical protein